MIEASTGPAPGNSPIPEPMTVPRRIARQASENSSRDGSICRKVIRAVAGFGGGVRALATISAMPNRPIATTPILSPSSRLVDPKVKRAAPEVMSMPTRPTTMPMTTEVSECTAEPRPSTAAPVMPSTTSAKYSGEPNDSATLASGGANSARMTMPTALPHSDAIVVMNRATPARPWRAIGYPSRHSTAETECGMLSNMAPVTAPYTAP